MLPKVFKICVILLGYEFHECCHYYYARKVVGVGIGFNDLTRVKISQGSNRHSISGGGIFSWRLGGVKKFGYR